LIDDTKIPPAVFPADPKIAALLKTENKKFKAGSSLQGSAQPIHKKKRQSAVGLTLPCRIPFCSLV